MKFNLSYFTKQRGIIIVSLIMCVVILASANFIYTRNKSDVPDIPSAKENEGNDNTQVDGTDSNEDTTDVVKKDDSDVKASQSNYFDAYRTNRQSIRDMEMRYVQTISGNESTEASLKKEAEERLLQIATLMETELRLESLIKAKGFEDVVAFVDEGSVNVVIKAEAISSSQATKILKIVVDETGESAQNVTIITRT